MSGNNARTAADNERAQYIAPRAAGETIGGLITDHVNTLKMVRGLRARLRHLRDGLAFMPEQCSAGKDSTADPNDLSVLTAAIMFEMNECLEAADTCHAILGSLPNP